MGILENESDTRVRITVLTIAVGKRARFRNFLVTCDSCGIHFTMTNMVLIATAESSVRNERLFRKFKAVDNDCVCPNCMTKELWMTCSDAPYVYDPGCGTLFDSSLWTTPGE